MPARPASICVLLLLGALLARSARAVAAPVEGRFEGFSKRLWEAKDGLPDETVNALAQTADGSLWIGTKGGLVRFDGVQFQSYDRESVPDGIERGVNALLALKNGDLLIGTEGSGLIRYRNRQFARFTTSDGQKGIFIRAIYQDRMGAVWVGSDQGLFRLEDDRLIRIDNTPALPALFVRSILEDGDGHLWVGGTQLLEFAGGKLMRRYPLPNGPSRSVIVAMLYGRDGTLWVGMLSGLYRVEKDGQLARAFALSCATDAIMQAADGTVWIGSVGQGLYYIRGSQIFYIPSAELPSRTVRTVFADRDGNLWLGTQAGLLRLSPTPVSIIAFPGGADSEFETLTVDRDQTIWVAASANLFHIRNDVATPYEFSGLPDIRVRTLLRGQKGDLWIGTDGVGLLHSMNGTVERFDAGHGLSNDFVRAILESRDGTIWVGTDGGLTHIAGKGTEIYEPASGLAYFSITALYEDSDQNIWIGTSRGLSRFSKGKFVHDPVIAALEQEEVWSITQDDSGTVWVGTSSGLYGIRNENLMHITAANGLASNKILQVLRDGKGNMWLSSSNNVSRVREHDLDDFTPGGRIQLSHYEDPYSLESAAFYSGMQPEGGIADNGDVWLASSKGAVRISGTRIAQCTLSPVAIEDARADDRSLPAPAKLVLQPGNGRLEISYAGIHLCAQGGLRYRYRMEGIEPWIEAGVRRTAYYTHIPPGHYRFRVQAYEIDDPSIVTEASILVVQEPPLYENPWFLALGVLALLGLVFLVYRVRLHQMHLRFQAVNAERTRLAREMHDTVIQGCVGVSTLLEAAQGLDNADEPLRQHLLGYATEQVRSTIEGARGAVWALRNISTSSGNVGEHCQELVRRMQLESDVPIQFEVSGTPFKMGEDASHELLMTIREALTNAIAHADASTIRLRAAFTEREVEITIADDGRGFDPVAVMKANGHYGMVGMTERTRLLGGTLSIESAAEKGTILRVKIPRDNKVVS
jgi:ligand-binding sensor domain-containing protein/signal transduction histidine kinase